MYDVAVARNLTYAFVQNGEVWVSIAGAQPRQLTHLGLSASDVMWGLSWSPSHRHLLVDAGAKFNTMHHVHYGAWIVTVPEGTTTALPSDSPLIDLCGGSTDYSGRNGCQWIDDRYLLYPNDAFPPQKGSTGYRVYDTVTQRAVSTPLDTLRVQPLLAMRSGALFFTPLGVPEIDRFDVTSGSFSLAFRLPGPAGGWSLSADGRRVVFLPTTPTRGAPFTPLPCGQGAYGSYLDASGATGQILPCRAIDTLVDFGPSAPQLSPDGVDLVAPAYTLSVASDGTKTSSPVLLRQRLSQATVTTGPGVQAPTPSEEDALGWLSETRTLVLQERPWTGGSFDSNSIQVYAVSGDRATPATLIETIDTRTAVVAALAP
jgi:hypothetical protein